MRQRVHQTESASSLGSEQSPRRHLEAPPKAGGQFVDDGEVSWIHSVPVQIEPLNERWSGPTNRVAASLPDGRQNLRGHPLLEPFRRGLPACEDQAVKAGFIDDGE